MARGTLRDLTGPTISSPGWSPPHGRTAVRAGPGITRHNARTTAGLPHAPSTEVSQSPSTRFFQAFSLHEGLRFGAWGNC